MDYSIKINAVIPSGLHEMAHITTELPWPVTHLTLIRVDSTSFACLTR